VIALLIVNRGAATVQSVLHRASTGARRHRRLNLEETDTLVVYGRPKPSLLFYAKRALQAGKPCIEVIKPGEEEKLRPVLDRPGQIMILTLDRLRAKLPAPPSTYQLVVSRHGYVLLAKKPVFKS